VSIATIEPAALPDVIIRDESTLRLTAPAAEDVDSSVAFFAGLSELSRYLRFRGFPTLRAELLHSWPARSS